MEQIVAVQQPQTLALVKPERVATGFMCEGIWVEFPFEPYDVQKEYMAKVIIALREGTNALLESPTGTGKTLCLLCAVLAWRESLKGAAAAQDAADAAAHAAAITSSLVQAQFGQALGSSMQPPVQTQLAARPDLPQIIYSSRTHGQLGQVVRELRGTTYKDRVQTSVLSSRQQTCLNPAVAKLPAGACNTACKVLVAGKKCSCDLDFARRFFVGALHHGCSLLNSRKRVVIKMSIEVGNHFWHNNLKFGGKGKQYASLLGTVPDIEEFLAVGRNNHVCPFYLGRDAAKDADMLFMPYNYLLDSNTRKTLNESVRWHNAVVLFDEGHNVEGVCSDASSWEISAKQLTDAMLEIKRCRELCLERIEMGGQVGVSILTAAGQGEEGGVNHRQLFGELDMLQRVFKLLEDGLHGLSKSLPSDGLTKPGAFLFDFLAQLHITPTSISAINATIDAAAMASQDYEVEMGKTSGGKGAAAALQHIQNCLNLAFDTLSPISERIGAPPAHKGYRVHIRLERSWGHDKLPAPTLCYWCFIPGMAFRRLRALHLRSILLTSGTLAPLDSFAAELQLPFPVRLENPHIIEAGQVWVGVVGHGPSGHTLNSSFKSRDTDAYKDDLGNAVVNFARVVPDGLLCFFPSYTVLNSCIDYWKANGAGTSQSTWERILRHKAPVIEPRESSLFAAAIEDFRTKLDDPSTGGAAFFAVCRGKVSEGLDFSDRAGRGVIITGIPFAGLKEAKVKLKREVLDEEVRAGANSLGGGANISGEQWYVQQAMRAVNQAMGRVIRHRWDYGAIILADERFGQASTQKSMSKWLQAHVVTYPNFGSAAGSLTKFFKEKAGFAAPAGYSSKGSGSATVARATTAFEFLTNSSTTSATDLDAVAASGGGGGGAIGAGSVTGAGRSLLACLPAAMDMSGISGLSSAMSRKASSSKHTTVAKAGASDGGAAIGSKGKQAQVKQGLFGLLQHAEDASAKAADSVIERQAGATTQTRQGSPALLTDGTVDSELESLLAAASTDKGLLESASLSSALQKASHQVAGLGRPPLAPRKHISIAYHDTANVSKRPTTSCVPQSNVLGPAHKVLQHQQSIAPAAGASSASSAKHVPSTNRSWEVAAPPMHARINLQAPVVPKLPATVSTVPVPQLQQGQHTRAEGQLVVVVAGSSLAVQDDQQAGPGRPVPGVAAVKAEEKAAVAPTPGQFLAQLKQELEPSTMSAVKAQLQQYKSNKDVQAFIDQVVRLLQGCTTAHLLLGFANFLPAKDRVWFTEVAQVHVSGAARLAAAASQPSAPAPHGMPMVAKAPSYRQPSQPPPAQQQQPQRQLAGTANIPAGAPAKPELHRREVQTPSSQAAPAKPGAAAIQHPSALRRSQSPSLPSALTDAKAAVTSATKGGSSMHISKTAGPGVSSAPANSRAPAQPARQPSSNPSSSTPLPLKRTASAAFPLESRAAAASVARGTAPSPSVPSTHVPSKLDSCQQLSSQAETAAAASTAAVPRPATAREAPAQPHLGDGAKRAKAVLGPACSICNKSPMEQAHEGPCGHLACYQCWLAHLCVYFACPVCKRQLRRQQLSRKHFV